MELHYLKAPIAGKGVGETAVSTCRKVAENREVVRERVIASDAIGAGKRRLIKKAKSRGNKEKFISHGKIPRVRDF